MVEINGIDLSQYISFEGLKCNYVKKYDTENEFITESGQHIKNVIGIQRTYDISLGNLPETTKNQLRNASLRGYVSATIDGISGQFLISNFTASLTLATDDGNIWSVSFNASYQKIEIDSSVEDKTDYGIGVYDSTGTKVARYSITNGDVIGSAKISSNSGGMPINGIYSSTLTFTVDRNTSSFVNPPTGALIKLEGYGSQDFFIKSRTLTKNTATFTCSDRIIKLDQIFPVDDYFNESTVWQVWNGSEAWMWGLVDSIRTFCGFGWADISDLDDNTWTTPLNDIRGKTCREILQTITSRRGGIFVARSGGDSGDGIKYIGPFSSKNTLIYTPNIRTEIIEGSIKGPISGVICTNTESGEVFTSGSISDPYLCLKLESKTMNQSDADILFDRVSGQTYIGFDAQRISLATSEIPVLGYRIQPSEDSITYYYPSQISVYISATGPFASLSAEDIVEDELQFITDMQKALDSIKNKIEAGQSYNGVSIDGTGLKCEGTAGKITLADGTIHFYGTGSDDDYTLSTTSGGYTQYTGIMESSKEAQSISVDTDNNTVTVTFTDGHIYTYAADVSQSDNTYSITNERSSWS